MRRKINTDNCHRIQKRVFWTFWVLSSKMAKSVAKNHPYKCEKSIPTI